MPDAEREKDTHGDDQALQESERRLLEDEEELFSSTDRYRTATRSLSGCLSLRTIALVQAAIIAILSGVLVVGIVVREERLPVRCAAYLNTGSKASSAQRPKRWLGLTSA